VPYGRQLLTLDEAATALGVAPGTLARWIALGRFPAYRTPGGRYRIAEDDLPLALEPARSSSRAETQDREGGARP